jgi:hypothetical protein
MSMVKVAQKGDLQLEEKQLLVSSVEFICIYRRTMILKNGRSPEIYFRYPIR